tara:strand:- start:1433 stop:2248 length:816 start_codon:yes stop_codon:yes gene_type:complete
MITERPVTEAAAKNSFWQNPPWAGAKPKYRLGLTPIPLEQWFTQPISPDVLRHKQNMLSNHYADVVAVSKAHGGDSAQCQLSDQLGASAEHPDLIANMALSVDDDLCIMQSTGEQRLVAGCVCSPSYWNLRSKIGKPMRLIHAPVASMNEKIGGSIERFIKGVQLLRPFERINWFVHGDTERWHPAEEPLPKTPVHTWYIRSERETLCRFSDEHLLFTINTRFQPLAAIADHPEAQQDLLATLGNLDADEVDYFGGARKCAMLTEYLHSLN